MKSEKSGNEDLLPGGVREYIGEVVRRVRYRRGIRREVGRELTDHFVEALGDCESEQERNEMGEKLFAEFGQAKVLAKLIRRGKKRCRPLWKKAMIRSVQATLVGIILGGVYTVWFIQGKPTVRVNYLVKLNQIAQPEVAAVQNGWHHWEKAQELYVDYKELELSESINTHYSQNDPNYLTADSSNWEFLNEFRSYGEYRSYDSLTTEQRKLLHVWLEWNESAWEEFVQIAKKAYCWQPYRHPDQGTSLLGFLPPNLARLQSLSNIGIWRARTALAKENNQEAINLYLALLRIAKHWQRKSIGLIEQLIGNRLCRNGHREILYSLKQSKLSKDLLQSLSNQLAVIYGDEFPLMDYETEKLYFMDTVQRVFTAGGPGGGHMIPERFRGIASYSYALLSADSIIDCMFHASRDETVKQGKKLFSLLDQFKGISPYERHVKQLSIAKCLEELPRQKYQFIYIIGPFRDNLLDSSFKTKALHEAVLTILALKRYQIDQGEYPVKLEGLVKGGYLRQLPDDPYSEGILRYERRSEDFILYSVGADFEDGGGRPEPGDEWGDEEDGGDRVFWPMEFE